MTHASPYPAIPRRRFVQGAAAIATLPQALSLAMAAPPPSGLLTGTNLALEIGPVPMNVTGHARVGIAVNGTVPAPILRWREGDNVAVSVTNRLSEPTSIHWHGLRVSSGMDGVPGFSFPGIAPGDTFVYRLPLRESGTFWYHGHSGFQEQSGLYGAIVIDPRKGYRQFFDRDYVVLLSDWSDENPATIVSNLKFQSDYYNYGRRTARTFFADARRQGLAAAISDRLDWGNMRMSPTDILDVTGATYTYLVNGQAPGANWTALFRPGERVRLRIINGSSMSIFDVRTPGLAMMVVQADGNEVEPVNVDEFRIGTAETYDVIVQPSADRAFTIFAQAMDRGGYARGTLAPRAGMVAPVPVMDPRPLRTMVDMGMANMGMANMDHGAMGGMSMDHGAMPGMRMDDSAPPAGLTTGVEVDNVAMMPADRLKEPGIGLKNNGRRVLTYSQLRATAPGADPRPPARDITLHLTGNTGRFIWGFDGKKFSDAEPIQLRRDERVRFILIDDTMMEHPIHLHGLWSELENGHGEFRPYKHTIPRQIRRTPQPPRHRRRTRALGFSLPSSLPHGDRHVPRGARRMSAIRMILPLCLAFAPASLAATMPSSRAMSDTGTMPPMMDSAVFSHALLDQLEGRIGGGQRDFRWPGQAWTGTDPDKLWLKTEGFLKRSGKVEDGRHELHYDRAIFTYLDLQAGLRTDLDSKTGRIWTALGVQGIAPLFFNYEATAYLSDRGQAAASLAVSYDLLMTQRLILQAEIEANFYGQADPGRGVGTGLADIEAGLRFRYDISRKFAPYIGVTYAGMFGETARMARPAGDTAGAVQLTFGIRSWF